MKIVEKRNRKKKLIQESRPFYNMAKENVLNQNLKCRWCLIKKWYAMLFNWQVFEKNADLIRFRFDLIRLVTIVIFGG